jgi:predicted thioesterase
MANIDLSGVAAGATGSASWVAEERHSARSVGSGTLEVFSTPMMCALMEAAAVDAVEALLPPGTTSLGTCLEITHDAPTPIGMTVRARAVLERIEGRTLHFSLEARDAAEVIGRGLHRRAVVDKARFLERLSRKGSVAG